MLSFKQLVALVQGRKREIALIWAAIVGLVVGASLLLPKQYTATAAVIVDVKAPELLEDRNSLSAGWIPGYVATQVDILRSERVAIRAIRALGLEKDEELRERWSKATRERGDFESWLASELQRKLDVKPSRESNALYVGFTAKDPKLAADFANAVVRGYIETSLDLRTEPSKEFADFFEARAKQLRDQLEAAQVRLSEYQRRTGILAREERVDVETARLNELSTQLVLAQSAAAEARGRSAQASADPNRSAEVLNNPVVSGLTADLSRQQARLQELTSRLGDEHPQVVETRASIAELRRRLNAMTTMVSRSVSATDDATRSRVAQLEAAVAAQRDKVLRLKEKRDEIDVLVRDVESAQKAYDLVLTRGNQTRIESKNTQTNVGVLKTATEPARPSSPNVTLNAVIAVVVGGLLALGYAVLREFTDRRLRTAEDAAQDLQVVVLCELVDTTQPDNRPRPPVLARLPGPAGA
jgi:chain length determinant protein EpsF